jgi:flavin reductase (DIM6/NTAB) family NADH-FMN oxidoreductase RutF
MTASPTPPTPLEQGHPADDPRAFRRSLGQFATGVTVMTTAHDGQLLGMSVNSFAALSLDPPLVLWSIRKESQSLPLFQQAGHYAVNVLAESQVDLSNLFAKHSEDRFAKVDWSTGRLGAPLLHGAICTLECRLEQLVDGGDHFILIGRVEHYAVHAGKPLLFAQGRYGLSTDMPPPAAAEDKPATGAPWLEQATLLRKFHFASHLMSARFDQIRAQTGYSVAEFRVYGWLRSHAMPEAEVRKRIYVGDAELQDAIAAMQARGHLLRGADGVLALTAEGKAQSDRNAEHVKAFEQQMFDGVAPADLDATRRVLRCVIDRAEQGLAS